MVIRLLTSSDYPIANDSQPAINVTTFDQLADALVNAGVTRINGSVLGDGSRYDDEYEVDTWGEGVAGVEAGPYDALMVNDSRTVGRSSRQPNPNEAAAREFVRLLDDRGITVGGSWGVGAADPAAAEIAVDPVGTARRSCRRDADHERQQHRRDAASRSWGSRTRRPAHGQPA